jgi:putative transposase
VAHRHAVAALSARIDTFSASEQTCAIVAVACEAPEASGVPLSHWSASDLAREAVKRGLVPAISPRTVGRFLKRS